MQMDEFVHCAVDSFNSVPAVPVSNVGIVVGRDLRGNTENDVSRISRVLWSMVGKHLMLVIVCRRDP